MPLTDGFNAHALKAKLVECLEYFGLTRDDISSKVVAMQADGAQVMQGDNGGLGAIFSQDFAPHMETMNCAALRADLSSEELDKNPAFQHLKSVSGISPL